MGHGRRHNAWREQPISSALPGRSGKLRPIVWLAIGALMIAWSLLAWLAYTIAAPLAGGLATTLDVAVDGGRDVANAVGGKAVSESLSLIDKTAMASVTGFIREGGRPIVVVIWGLGMLFLAALPFGLIVLRRLSGRIGYH